VRTIGHGCRESDYALIALRGMYRRSQAWGGSGQRGVSHPRASVSRHQCVLVQARLLSYIAISCAVRASQPASGSASVCLGNVPSVPGFPPVLPVFGNVPSVPGFPGFPVSCPMTWHLSELRLYNCRCYPNHS
jgi:hypothetical protein